LISFNDKLCFQINFKKFFKFINFLNLKAIGSSGARIVTNLVYELRRRKGKYAIGSACIGGGQGIAVMIENVN
jgi:hypothetical protein